MNKNCKIWKSKTLYISNLFVAIIVSILTWNITMNLAVNPKIDILHNKINKLETSNKELSQQNKNLYTKDEIIKEYKKKFDNASNWTKDKFDNYKTKVSDTKDNIVNFINDFSKDKEDK